jgi:hypothetical protein
MVALLNPSADVEQTVSNLYVMEKVTVPAFSETKFAVRPSAVEGGTMSPGDGIVTGSVHFSDHHDLHPFLNVVTKCDKDGQVRVGVMNTTMEPIVIPVGTKYGSFSRIVDASNHSEHPFRIAIINNIAEETETKSADQTEPELAPWLVGPATEANREARVVHLISVFKLRDSPLLDTADKVAQASCMLLKRWACFSFDGNYGQTTLLKHSIVTEPDQRPINQRFRPVNPHLEVDLRKQINKWLTHGVIEKSCSPWNFGLVAAPKKGGAIRWCVDFRALNDISSISSAPIGNVEDNLDRLSRSTVFSGIDSIGAFHVIELEDKDKAKTAFATPWGSYQFVRMPFGFAGGPSSYARLVHMVLDGIPYTQALPYLDDTVIHSKDLPGHFLALNIVLEAYEKAGLKLQPAKCQLFQREIEYLGHNVSAKGIAPVPGYVQVVKDWPMPSNRSEVRTFLGKTGYYCRFMENYAEIAGPLTDILKQDGTDDRAPFDQTSKG